VVFVTCFLTLRAKGAKLRLEADVRVNGPADGPLAASKWLRLASEAVLANFLTKNDKEGSR
jgi:hypothetical protein